MAFPWEIDPAHILKGKRLGGGNFGDVYKGECRSLPVAIKIPRIQELDEEELFALKQEVQIWSAKPHPNIVQFIGACTIPNKFQIVTELLDGDLETLLRSKEPLSMLELMAMAQQIALGMNWLHRSNPAIIHRDLKTANVLYKKTGNTFEIKISDFGLAQIKPHYLKQLRDPKDGARGTPLYMAPEILLGKPFNEKADIHAFGICLWEIVERKDPFSNFSDYDTFRDAVALRGIRPPLGPDKFGKRLRRLIEACWEPDPSKRPDFETIANELLAIIVHAAITDKQGRKFWLEYFLHKQQVPWKKFVEAFYTFLGKELPMYEFIKDTHADSVADDDDPSAKVGQGKKVSPPSTAEKLSKEKVREKEREKEKEKEKEKDKGKKEKGSKTEKGGKKEKKKKKKDNPKSARGKKKEEKEKEKENKKKGAGSKKGSEKKAASKDASKGNEPLKEGQAPTHIGQLTKAQVTDIVNYRCLRAILAQKRQHKLIVDIQWFGSVLMWFGPLRPGAQPSVLDEMRTMLTYPWFHGDIDAAEAGRRLRGMPAGTFLIRFSLTVPGSYTISRVVDSQKDKVANSRIKYVPGQGFTVGDNNKLFFESLSALIHSLKNQLGLTHACGGSQYVELFKLEPKTPGDDETSTNHYFDINLEDQ